MRALLALVPLAGCIILSDGKDCDASAAGSVAVTVSDDGGGAVPGAEVWFSTHGRDFRPCDAFGPEGEWVCGWEEAGNILVRVEAEGYTTFEDSVFVERGECHVVPQHVDAVLIPEDVVECDELALASVVATVVGAGGEALTDVRVGWHRAEEDLEEPRPCDPADDGTWSCGWEVEGALTIVASADGHATETVDALVGADACHVITEHVELALDWLPD